ncbi:hypothetical protein PUF88_00770 [Lactobacillaceae bacterium L1_55_11]|nr:hypothetical protein [Lactobacillaceae bacterium L1_55_11]
MNKQVLYAVLTLALIPIGCALVAWHILAHPATVQSARVRVVSDNWALTSLTTSLAGKRTQIDTFTGPINSGHEQNRLQEAELVLAAGHQDELISKVDQWTLKPKITIASDYQEPAGPNVPWLDPDFTKRLTGALTDDLADVDPHSRDTYLQKRTKVNQTLAQSIKVKDQIKGVAQGQTYLNLGNRDWTDLGFLGLKKLSQPSPDQWDDDAWNNFNTALSQGQVKFLLINQDSARSANGQLVLAQAAQVGVPTLIWQDYGSGSTSFLNWQLQKLKLIQTTLDGTKKE